MARLRKVDPHARRIRRGVAAFVVVALAGVVAGAGAAPARVRVTFFARDRGGTASGKLGTLAHVWMGPGTIRADLRLSAARIAKLRHARLGFVADFEVASAPGYCPAEFTRVLDVRRKVTGQTVWFQEGSLPADLPADSGGGR